MRLDGFEAEAETEAHEAALALPDFDGAIRHGAGKFMTRESARRHAQVRTFIERDLAAIWESGTTAVIITHHAPTPRSVGARFEGAPTNPASASDLEELIAQHQPALWIHGHMHDQVDVTLGETRVLSKPAGYEAVANEQRGHKPELCVEITVGEV